jgi:hypothetical protein
MRQVCFSRHASSLISGLRLDAKKAEANFADFSRQNLTISIYNTLQIASEASKSAGDSWFI